MIRITKNKGISILEIIIAFVIMTIVLMPTIELLFSMNLERIKNIPNFMFENLLALDSNLKWNQNGSLVSVIRNGGVYDVIPSGFLKSQNCSCIDTELNDELLAHIPQTFIYSREELGLSTTTVTTGVSVLGGNIFLSTNSSSTTEPDLIAYSLNNTGNSSTKPGITKNIEINTGPGIINLSQTGFSLIAANSSVNSQVQIFDVLPQGAGSGLGNGEIGVRTQLKTTYTIPESNSSTNPLTKIVRIANGLLYIGTEKSVLPEISIYRLSDHSLLSQIETDYGINDMLVIGNTLIVAGPRDPEIEVFNIPYSAVGGQNVLPIKIGEFDAPGGSGNGKVLQSVGDKIFLGRTKGGNEILSLQAGLFDPADPSDLFSLYFASSSQANSLHFQASDILHTKIGWSVDALVPALPYVLVFSADQNKELQIFKITQNLFGGEKADLIKTVDLPGRVSSVACRKNTIYVTTVMPDYPLIVINL